MSISYFSGRRGELREKRRKLENLVNHIDK